MTEVNEREKISVCGVGHIGKRSLFYFGRKRHTVLFMPNAKLEGTTE